MSQLDFDKEAAEALGVSLEQLHRMREQHQRFMEQFSVTLYLESPRTWGTIETAIDQALTRKRRERMNR